MDRFPRINLNPCELKTNCSEQFYKAGYPHQLCPYSENLESFYFIEAIKPYSRIKLSEDFHMTKCD